MKHKITLLFIILNSLNLAFAQNLEEKALKLDSTIYAGTGCPKESLSIEHISETVIFLNFKDFEIETSRLSAKVARKNCSVAIPFALEKNKRLAIRNLSLNLLADFNRKNTLDVNSELFLDTERSIKITESLTGSGELDYINLSDNNEVLLTECGEAGLLRLNSSLLLKVKKSESSLIKLGNDEHIPGITAFITEETCQM